MGGVRRPRTPPILIAKDSQRVWKKQDVLAADVRRIHFHRTVAHWLCVIFTAGALLGSFGISLSKWSMIGTPQYVGLENYKYMVNDRFFWQSLMVTIYYLLNVPLNLLLGLLLAILLNQKFEE